MNQPQVYTCSPSQTPTCFLPHPILLGWSSAPALSALFPCIELGPVIYFTYGNIHVAMLVSQIISPSPSPQSPKACSLHLCLFCCLAYRVTVTVFLNSIYIGVHILYWCFCFWLTSLCIIGSSFIHFIRTDSNAFLNLRVLIKTRGLC